MSSEVNCIVFYGLVSMYSYILDLGRHHFRWVQRVILTFVLFHLAFFVVGIFRKRLVQLCRVWSVSTSLSMNSLPWSRLCTYLLYEQIGCNDKVDDALVYHVYVRNFSIVRWTFVSSTYLKLVLLYVHFTWVSVVVCVDGFFICFSGDFLYRFALELLSQDTGVKVNVRSHNI